jgi:hypothetical protein
MLATGGNVAPADDAEDRAEKDGGRVQVSSEHLVG